MSISELNVFGQRLSKFMVKSGSIFIVPVPFMLNFPTRFIQRTDTSESLSATKSAEIVTGNRWLNEETGEYQIGDQEEIALEAKVRPLLILSRFEFRDVVWHGSYVLGLPIGSVKPRMEKDASYNKRLKSNKLKFLHYLSPENNPNLGLDKPSFVVTVKPVVLLDAFFTHYCGHITPDELYKIRGRYNSFN